MNQRIETLVASPPSVPDKKETQKPKTEQTDQNLPWVREGMTKEEWEQFEDLRRGREDEAWRNSYTDNGGGGY